MSIRVPPRTALARRPLVIGDTWLLPASPAHADSLFEFVEADRERLARWLPWVSQVRRRRDLEDFLKASAHEWDTGSAFRWVFHLPDDPAYPSLRRASGIIGFEDVHPHHGRARLGYWLYARHEGRGHVTRAARRLLAFGFEEVGLHRVEIAVAVGNDRSRRVVERIGGRFEGVLREAEWLGDRYVNHAVFSVLRTDMTPREGGAEPSPA